MQTIKLLAAILAAMILVFCVSCGTDTGVNGSSSNPSMNASLGPGDNQSLDDEDQGDDNNDQGEDDDDEGEDGDDQGEDDDDQGEDDDDQGEDNDDQGEDDD